MTSGRRMEKLIIRIAGLLLVSGVSFFLLVAIVDMAYPAITQCEDYAYGYGQSQCREYGTRPVFLDPIMNGTFSAGMWAIAVSGAAVFGVFKLKAFIENRS
jgi:hypothetical protein